MPGRPPKAPVPAILFVCTANQYRSPLAAVLFRRLLEEDGRYPGWHVASAGTWTAPGLPLNPRTIKIAQQLGGDLSAQRTQLVNAELLEEFDLILVMESGHRESLSTEFPACRPRLHLLAELADGRPSSIPDPGTSRISLEEVCRDLSALLERGFPRIVAAAQDAEQQRRKPLGTPAVSFDHLTLGRLLTISTDAETWAAFSAPTWQALLQAVLAEGVAPLLSFRLAETGQVAMIPPAARAALRTACLNTWRNNQEIIKELQVLARHFSQAGIPVVVLKGACFALTIYPDPGLRPMSDLDLLIPREKLPRAVEIATRLGYSNTLPEAMPGLRDLLGHDIYLQRGGLSLELHHSLVADRVFRYAVPVDWFWTQTEPLASPPGYNFENLAMLTPAAQMLYSAAHAMLQHGGQQAPLRWFYDLHLLVQHYGSRLDWDLLIAQAREFAWASALEAALAHTTACFATPIPACVRARLAEKTDRHQKLVAAKQVKAATHTADEYRKIISLNWRGRFRLVQALLFPSPAYMRWRYQLKAGWALPLYYLLRWGGILKDVFRTLFSAARQKP